LKTKEKGSLYHALFHSYLLLFAIAISSIFVLYARINDSILKQTEKSKTALVTQLRDSVDERIQYADSLRDELIADDKLMRIATANNDYTRQALSSDIQSSYKPDYLINCCVYFSGLDEVIAGGVSMRAPKYFEYMYKPLDISYKEFWLRYLTGYHLKSTGPLLRLQSEQENTSDVLPYIQTFPYSGQPLGQIIIFLDVKDIASQISQISESTFSDVYVFNENKGLVLSSTGAPVPSEVLKKGIDLNKDIFEFNRSGKQMVVMTSCSTLNGWKYVLVSSKNIYFHDNIRFAITCAAIFAVYLAIGLLVGHLLAKRNSRPMREISDMIIKYTNGKSGATASDEPNAIKNTLLEKFSTDQELSHMLEEQRPVLTRAYLLSLARGLETDYEEAPERLRSLGIELVSEDFSAVGLEFDLESPFFQEKTKFPDVNYSLARVIMQNVGGELLGRYFQCFYLDIDCNQSFFLLISREQGMPEDAEENMRKCVKALDGFTKDNFQLGAVWGISQQHSGYRNLPKCYDEMKKALENEKKKSTAIVSFSDVRDDSSDYFFPTEIEYQLVNLLKNGNYHESKELLENVFKINESCFPGSRSQINRGMINAIASVLTRSMNAVLAKEGKASVGLLKPEGKSEKTATLKASEDCCLKYIDLIAHEAQDKTVSKTELLLNEIVSYIDSNIESNSLDLNTLSDRFKVTPQYISNIFKRYKKENIKEYISKQKLNRAQEMLVNTDLSINKISMQLGYVNELGIFRLFKKYENMTPGEYRFSHKKKNEET
jgi:AraC-like DNA-binding protein